MRTRFTLLTALLAFAAAGCSSGTTVVVYRPGPAPAPEPQRLEPLELEIARPYRQRMLVQTSRPAYVAIFEIIPDRGVALVHPANAQRRHFVLSGMSWVPAWWESDAPQLRGASAAERDDRRIIYAIASDRPLRMTNDAFEHGYLRRVLGPAVYRSSNPYATMRALSRRFVNAMQDEEWAEAMYELRPGHASRPHYVVRIYCPNRVVYEVPEEVADRVWCPTRDRVVADGEDDGRLRRDHPVRPDSVVGRNGRRIATRSRPERDRGPYRIAEPQPAAADSARRGSVVDRAPVAKPGNPAPSDTVRRETIIDRAPVAKPGKPAPRVKPDSQPAAADTARRSSVVDRARVAKPGRRERPSAPDNPKQPEHPVHPEHPEHPEHSNKGGNSGGAQRDSSAAPGDARGRDKEKDDGQPPRDEKDKQDKQEKQDKEKPDKQDEHKPAKQDRPEKQQPEKPETGKPEAGKPANDGEGGKPEPEKDKGPDAESGERPAANEKEKPGSEKKGEPKKGGKPGA